MACIRKMRDKKFLHVAVALFNYSMEIIFQHNVCVHFSLELIDHLQRDTIQFQIVFPFNLTNIPVEGAESTIKERFKKT